MSKRNMSVELVRSTALSKTTTVVRKNIMMWLLLLPSLYVMFICIWKPTFTGFYMSLFETRGYDIVKFVGMKNYVDVLTDTMFLQTLYNTVLYVLWSIVIGYFLPMIVAFVLNEIIHCKSLFRLCIYSPVVMPSVAASLIWYFLFLPGDNGVLNQILRVFGGQNQDWLLNSKYTIMLIIVTMTWKGFGQTTLVYLASLQSINQELYEAATLDGAGIFRKIKNITIPHIMPMALLMLVNQIITLFQVYQQPMIMTDGGPNNASMTLNLTAYYQAFRYMRADKALAIGVISFFILLVITIFYFRLKKKVEDM